MKLGLVVDVGSRVSREGLGAGSSDLGCTCWLDPVAPSGPCGPVRTLAIPMLRALVSSCKLHAVSCSPEKSISHVHTSAIYWAEVMGEGLAEEVR